MITVKNNFFVVTGGPGGGKSTLLAELSTKGYHVVDETGRAIIKDRLSKGLSPRPELKEFARLMFQKDVENYYDNLNRAEPVFFDRSFLDSASFIQQTDIIYFGRIKEIINSCRFNPCVFMTPPWKEIYRNDAERDQTFAEAIAIYDRLFEWYQANDYQVVVLPKVTKELRVEFMLDKISS